MMFKTIGISAVFVFALLLACIAADLVTGHWDGTVDTQNGQMKISYDLKTEGDKLTGSLTSENGEIPIYDGKVKGEEISFKITYGDLVIPHTGKVVGDTLKMKIQIQDDVIESKFVRGVKK